MADDPILSIWDRVLGPGPLPAGLAGHVLRLGFGESDRAWVTTLVLPSSGKGTLTGRAADDAVVLSVVERIKKNPKFTDVKGPNTQQADGRTREVTFTVTFTFTRE